MASAEMWEGLLGEEGVDPSLKLSVMGGATLHSTKPWRRRTGTGEDLRWGCPTKDSYLYINKGRKSISDVRFKSIWSQREDT